MSIFAHVVLELSILVDPSTTASTTESSTTGSTTESFTTTSTTESSMTTSTTTPATTSPTKTISSITTTTTTKEPPTSTNCAQDEINKLLIEFTRWRTAAIIAFIIAGFLLLITIGLIAFSSFQYLRKRQ
jgi:hypothetical protein